MNHWFSYTIEREDAEGNGLTFEVEVDGTYHFGSPPSYNDPGDADEYEITSITFNGAPFETTPEEDEAILDFVYNNPLDYGDYDYD